MGVVEQEKTHMNYDASISTEVSLSRVLDEMILDNTDLQVIVSFLKGHEGQINDIYRNSAFVYDLYDLAAHPYRVNDFLVRHIVSLHPTDMCFAGEFLGRFLATEDVYPEVRCVLRDVISGNDDFFRFRTLRFRTCWYRGQYFVEGKVASGELDLIKLMESISSDSRDIKKFLQESYLARSILMATNFLNFSSRTQFVILSSVKDILCNSFLSLSVSSSKHLAHAVNLLLKQLLLSGKIEMFNWVVNVLEIRPITKLSSSKLETFVRELESDQTKSIPTFLWQRIAHPITTFEETVFEMNMVETQFDILDLFIYIYVFDSNLFKGMKENVELLEFFNLPFKWDELEKFQGIGSN